VKFPLSVVALLAGFAVLPCGHSHAQQQPAPDSAQAQQKGGDPGEQANSGNAQEQKPSPEEKMRRRFPQPVRVGDLIGLPLLDEHDSTISRIQAVVRTNESKILFIVPCGGLFGLGQRLVAVPIEVVAILGRQVAAVDMPRDEFSQAPTWYGSNSTAIPAHETIRIAVARR
jgi:hypothetical protein